jgi:hypothetical protein
MSTAVDRECTCYPFKIFSLAASHDELVGIQKVENPFISDLEFSPIGILASSITVACTIGFWNFVRAQLFAMELCLVNVVTSPVVITVEPIYIGFNVSLSL